MLKILYASETGNSENESYNLAYEIKNKLNIDSEVLDCDSFGVENLTDEKFIIFMISTSGQGDPPENMKEFWEFLLIEDLPDNALEELNFTIFGFGDSSYKKYNAMARKLYQRLIALGANISFKRELGDDVSQYGYIKDLNVWKNDLFVYLKGYFEIKDDISIPSEYPFSINYKGNDKNYISTNNVDENTTILKNNLISEKNHFQKIYDMDILNKNKIKYKPGDIIKIRPKINTELVNNLINFLNLNKDEIIDINLNNNYKKIYQNKFINYRYSIFELFSEVLDFVKPINFSFFKSFSKFINEDNIYKEKIEEIDYNEFYEYVVKEKRNLYEIIKDFSIKDIPLEVLIQYLPIIKYRDYSISSSYLVNDNVINIQYSLTDYMTPFKRKIKGLCTNFLYNLKENDQIKFKIQEGLNHFIPDNNKLVQIIVCTGTGITPFLSLIKEKQYNNILNKNNTILYFGCRNKNKDFVNKSYLEELEDKDLITLNTAFSRDQEEKIYVQHLIDKDDIFISNIFKNIDIKNINIYICGNSKFLPISIEKSFRGILKNNFNSEDKLDYMIENNQFILESWS